MLLHWSHLERDTSNDEWVIFIEVTGFNSPYVPARARVIQLSVITVTSRRTYVVIEK